MSITFTIHNSINGIDKFEFGDPIPVTEFSFNLWEFTGLYAIMMKTTQSPNAYYDYSCKNYFEVLYIGRIHSMFGDFKYDNDEYLVFENKSYKSHESYNCWIKEAGSDENLYISLHPMHYSNPKERRKLQSELIKLLRPKCHNLEEWDAKWKSEEKLELKTIFWVGITFIILGVVCVSITNLLEKSSFRKKFEPMASQVGIPFSELRSAGTEVEFSMSELDPYIQSKIDTQVVPKVVYVLKQGEKFRMKFGTSGKLPFWVDYPVVEILEPRNDKLIILSKPRLYDPTKLGIEILNYHQNSQFAEEINRRELSVEFIIKSDNPKPHICTLKFGPNKVIFARIDNLPESGNRGAFHYTQSITLYTKFKVLIFQ